VLDEFGTALPGELGDVANLRGPLVAVPGHGRTAEADLNGPVVEWAEVQVPLRIASTCSCPGFVAQPQRASTKS